VPTLEEIKARRARERARRRRRQRVLVVAVLVVVVAAVVLGVVTVKRMGEAEPASPTAQSVEKTPKAQATPKRSATATPTATPSPTPTPSASPTQAAYVVGGPAAKPHMIKDYISFPAKRRAEMASYAQAHYGTSDITLRPKVIVLHYTDGSTYDSAHSTFESDAPNMGVLPGTVAHFVIDEDGTIYQQLPLTYMGRHTVGLNYCSIGIENVQPPHGSDASTVAQILDRPKERKALVDLVRWLMYRYHIRLDNVIGHGTANDSPYYKDLKGWTNDHVDFEAPQVQRVRALIKKKS
jgi:N-acetylmuramoyl-L-alanine amidase